MKSASNDISSYKPQPLSLTEHYHWWAPSVQSPNAFGDISFKPSYMGIGQSGTPIWEKNWILFLHSFLFASLGECSGATDVTFPTSQEESCASGRTSTDYILFWPHLQLAFFSTGKSVGIRIPFYVPLFPNLYLRVCGHPSPALGIKQVFNKCLTLCCWALPVGTS